MKRSTMSITVILITILSVVIMLYSSGNITFEFNLKKKLADLSNNSRNYASLTSQSLNDNLKKLQLSTETQKQVVNLEEKEKQEYAQKKQSGLKNQAENNNSNDKRENIEREGSEKSITVSTIKKYNNVVVFKVPKEEFEASISSLDKARLLALASKISPIDYSKIEGYLREEDGETAIVNTIALLKTRLSKRDYEKLREIVDRYIDIDRLEKALAA